MQLSENRRPTRKARLLLMLAAAITGFSALLYFASVWIGMRPVKSVTVSGNSIIPSEDILSGLDTLALNADNILLAVKSRVKQNPYVQNTIISHKQAGQLSIEIKEKTPVAIVVNDSGETAIIDHFAQVLPMMGYRNCSNLPVLRGAYSSMAIDTVALAGFYAIIDQLAALNSPLLNSFVSEISYDRPGRSYTIVSTENAARVYLGTIDNIDAKLGNLAEFLAARQAETDFSLIDYIDLRWHQLVALHERAGQAVYLK